MLEIKQQGAVFEIDIIQLVDEGGLGDGVSDVRLLDSCFLRENIGNFYLFLIAGPGFGQCLYGFTLVSLVTNPKTGVNEFKVFFRIFHFRHLLL